MTRIPLASLLIVLSVAGATTRAGVDLRIESVLHTAAVPGPLINQPVEVVVRVANRGDVAAGPFTISLWKNQLAEPAHSTGADDSKQVLQLAPGEANAIEVTFEVAYQAAGTYTLWAWADSEDQAFDVIPSNNKYSILLTATENWPDLFVEGIVPEVERPRAGELLIIIVNIRNQGQMDAGATGLALWKNRLLPPADAADADVHVVMEAIPATEFGTVSIPVTYDAPGTYRVWIMTDTGKTLTEINENNNAAYIEVTVAGKNALVDLTHSACGADGAGGLPIFGLLGMAGLVAVRRTLPSRKKGL